MDVLWFRVGKRADESESVFARDLRPFIAPFLVRVIDALPWLQGITARFIGLGVRPEHVRSPMARSG